MRRPSVSSILPYLFSTYPLSSHSFNPNGLYSVLALCFDGQFLLRKCLREQLPVEIMDAGPPESKTSGGL